QSPDVPRSHPDCPTVEALTHPSDPDRARTRAVVASPSTFLNGAHRRCRLPSAFRYYFSRKGLIERPPAGCVKAIAVAAPPRKNVHRRKCGPHIHFSVTQRDDVRETDEMRPINFELNVAPHASGSVLVS